VTLDSCVGADPGPATGLCFLDYDSGRLVGRTLLQVIGPDAPVVLKGMLLAYYGEYPKGFDAQGSYSRNIKIGRRVASAEKFVTGASAGSRGKPAEVTRQLVMELAEVLELFGYAVTIRPAADVKPWASDKRLVAAGVVNSEKGMHGDMNHAYDAARHCLYGAHEAGVIRDPLIRKREA
jgi:hypothetical protein